VTEIFNLLDGDLPPAKHARDGHRFLNRSIGTELNASLASLGAFELAPGEAGPAYHYELMREEWLFVVSGEVTLRTPEGGARAPCGRCGVLPAGRGRRARDAQRG